MRPLLRAGGRLARVRRFAVPWPDVCVGLLAVAFVGVSTVFALGNYHHHAGDFGQYVTQARNLIHARPFTFLMEGYAVVLPGYPIALAGLIALFGVDFYAIGIVNSILWACTALLAWACFKDRMGSWEGVVFVLIVLFSAYVTLYQQRAMPNIPFACVTLAACVAFRTLMAKPESERSLATTCALAVVALVPAVFRSDSIALYVGFIAYSVLVRRRWGHLSTVAIVGVALALALDSLIATFGDQRSSILHGLSRVSRHGAGSSLVDLPSVVLPVAHMGLTYIKAHCDVVLGNACNAGPAVPVEIVDGHVIEVGGLWLLLVTLTGLGVVRSLKRAASFEAVFLVTHLGLISLFVILEHAAPLRYVFPTVPIAVFYCIQGVSWGLNGMSARWLRFLLAPLAVTVTVHASTQQWDWHRDRNIVTAPPMVELVAYLSEHRGSGTIGYLQPRSMIALLDDGSRDRVQVTVLRNVRQARRLLRSEGNLLVVWRTWELRTGQREVLDLLEESARASVVFENEKAIVFRVGAAERKDG